MRALSTMFFGLTIWAVLAAVGVAHFVTPAIVETFTTIAEAL